MTDLFQSFLMAGFECSTHISPRAGRHDLLRDTRHDEQARADYERLKHFGILSVREGLRWHLIESEPGRYHWESVLPLIAAARQSGTQVIWDLFHYGWPQDLDIFSGDFLERFAALAAAFARLVREELPGPHVFAPVNEISFFSWAAGTHALFYPFERGRGWELKRQLVRASLAACDAVWAEIPAARVIHPDPVVHIVPNPDKPHLSEEAEGYRRAQWDGWNMLSGRMDPELGGSERHLDLLGLNFYPANQWEYEGTRIALGDARWRPFHDIALEAYQRYGRPLVITETGAEGSLRPTWLRYMTDEVELSLERGVPILGMCLYPILDHPGWDDRRHVSCGLWGYRRRGERRLHPEVAQATLEASRRLQSRPRVTAGH